MSLTVVCFKWKPRPREGFVEPPCVVTYGPEHVNTLRRMVARHLSLEHEFVCVTDDPEGVDPGIRVVPLWDHCIELGGCYNRLYTFSADMREILGPRFVCIDLDCVVTDSLDPLLDRDEDFIINSYKGGKRDPDQYYNGGMYMMNAGARAWVWERFEGEASVRYVNRMNQKRLCTGTDQGWVRLMLGRGEARWTEADGVYEVRQFRRNGLRADARIVFFAGKRDPTTREWRRRQPWIQEHYR